MQNNYNIIENKSSFFFTRNSLKKIILRRRAGFIFQNSKGYTNFISF